MVVVLAGVGQGLDHQLQGADAIAIERIDRPAVAAAMRPARELARHDEPLVGNLMILIGHVPEEPPAGRVAFVRFDRRFQQFVDFAGAIEPLERRHRFVQIVAGRNDRFIEQQPAEGVVGVAEVAVLECLVGHFAPLPHILGTNGG